jgi:hypothetical protein
VPLPDGALPVEQYTIFRRLYERLKVRPGGVAGLVSLSTKIVPVVSFSDLLWRSRAWVSSSASIGAGVAVNQVVATVPAGVRYELRNVTIGRISGDNTIDQVQLYDASRVEGFALEVFAAATRWEGALGVSLLLDEGDYLRVHTAGVGSVASVFQLGAWVREMDVY